MYLGIDIGGTKTLVAILNNQGVIRHEVKFPTPQDYDKFKHELAATLAQLTEAAKTSDFRACGVGAPGVIDHRRGRGLDFGHLPWKDVPILHDVERLVHCPVVLENDAKLAGLSEAMLVKEFHRVLYVTVSTGIGAGYIVGQRIDPELAGNEPGHMILSHQGKYRRWEEFAAGSAIVRQFGKPMSDIHDARTLKTIARNIAIGLIDLTAVLTPDIIIIGGSIGTHFDKYAEYLQAYMEQYDNPMIQLPVIAAAKRPEKAVIYGCYDLARQTYGHK